MKKIIFLILTTLYANAHFLTFMANTDNIFNQKHTKVNFDISFVHPFEQTGMVMEKPEVFVNSKNNKLNLIQTIKFNQKAWSSSYEIKTPGIYKFFVQPQPYFEPSE